MPLLISRSAIPLTPLCTLRRSASASKTSTRNLSIRRQCCSCLAKDHPLLDGNKRAARVTLQLFIDMNGWLWNPYPSTDDAEQAVLSVASEEWNEERTAEWLQTYLIRSAEEVT